MRRIVRVLGATCTRVPFHRERCARIDTASSCCRPLPIEMRVRACKWIGELRQQRSTISTSISSNICARQKCGRGCISLLQSSSCFIFGINVINDAAAFAVVAASVVNVLLCTHSHTLTHACPRSCGLLHQMRSMSQAFLSKLNERCVALMDGHYRQRTRIAKRRQSQCTSDLMDENRARSEVTPKSVGRECKST